jgi:hypothetical protein
VNVNPKLPRQKQHSKKALFTNKLDLNLRKKLQKCYIWSLALYGDITLALQNVDQKYLVSFGMSCQRRMEKTSWTDHVKLKYYIEPMRRGISYVQKKGGCLAGLVTFGMGTAF